MESMLRLTSSPALKHLLEAAKDSAREQFELDPRSDNRDNLRSLIKCILWTSLQRWKYKDRDVKRDQLQESAIDDDSSLLDEPSDLEQEQDGLVFPIEDETSQDVVSMDEIAEERSWKDCSSSYHCGFARSEIGTVVSSISEPDLDGDSIKVKSAYDELNLDQDVIDSNEASSTKSELMDFPSIMFEGLNGVYPACPWSESSSHGFSPLMEDANSVRPPSEPSSGQEMFPEEPEDVDVLRSDDDMFFED